MRNKRCLFILLATLLWLSASWLLIISIANADASPAQETGLNAAGTAYELNRDAQGNLWLSDYGANEIWQVNPATGVYTIYLGLANATDARRDAAGVVWWLETGSNNLGRLTLNPSTVTTWTLPGMAPLAIAFDVDGRVWTSDFYQVHRFAPDTSEVCTYPMPNNGYSLSIAAQGGVIWLGDGQQERILKLDPAANMFTRWQLTANALPRGLTVAENGDLWWADEDLQALARLEPDSNRLTTYPLRADASPKTITLRGGKVWYTASSSRTFGVLDPTTANGTTATLLSSTTPITPTCSHLEPGLNATVAISTGILAWTPTVYTRTVTSGGWTVYELPTEAYPWGIAASTRDVWVVDQGRHKLVRLPETPQGRIVGHLFQDDDGNGVQNGSEPDLAGVQVVITDTLGVTQTVTTNTSGDYSATVPAGATTVDVVDSTLPAGAVQTAGSDPTIVTVTGDGTVNVVNGYQVRTPLKRVYVPLIRR